MQMTQNFQWSNISENLTLHQSLEKFLYDDVILWRHEIFPHIAIIAYIADIHWLIRYIYFHNLAKIMIDNNFYTAVQSVCVVCMNISVLHLVFFG